MAVNSGFGGIFASSIQLDNLHIRRKQTTRVSNVDSCLLFIASKHPDNDPSFAQGVDSFRYYNSHANCC